MLNVDEFSLFILCTFYVFILDLKSHWFKADYLLTNMIPSRSKQGHSKKISTVCMLPYSQKMIGLVVNMGDHQYHGLLLHSKTGKLFAETGRNILGTRWEKLNNKTGKTEIRFYNNCRLKKPSHIAIRIYI